MRTKIVVTVAFEMEAELDRATHVVHNIMTQMVEVADKGLLDPDEDITITWDVVAE